jgi:BTB/POZ domain
MESSAIQSHFAKLFDEEKFCDIKLHLSNRQLYCHKNILALSPYFATLLSDRWFSKKALYSNEVIDGSNANTKEAVAATDCIELEIEATAIQSDCMYQVVRFLYGIIPEINDVNARSLLEASAYFDIPTLGICVSDAIFNSINNHNVVTYCLCVANQELGEAGKLIEDACLAYIYRNAVDIGEQLAKLPLSHHRRILTAGELYCTDEFQRYQLAVLMKRRAKQISYDTMRNAIQLAGITSCRGKAHSFSPSSSVSFHHVTSTNTISSIQGLQAPPNTPTSSVITEGTGPFGPSRRHVQRRHHVLGSHPMPRSSPILGGAGASSGSLNGLRPLLRTAIDEQVSSDERSTLQGGMQSAATLTLPSPPLWTTSQSPSNSSASSEVMGHLELIQHQAEPSSSSSSTMSSSEAASVQSAVGRAIPTQLTLLSPPPLNHPNYSSQALVRQLLQQNDSASALQQQQQQQQHQQVPQTPQTSSLHTSISLTHPQFLHLASPIQGEAARDQLSELHEIEVAYHEVFQAIRFVHFSEDQLLEAAKDGEVPSYLITHAFDEKALMYQKLMLANQQNVKRLSELDTLLDFDKESGSDEEEDEDQSMTPSPRTQRNKVIETKWPTFRFGIEVSDIFSDQNRPTLASPISFSSDRVMFAGSLWCLDLKRYIQPNDYTMENSEMMSTELVAVYLRRRAILGSNPTLFEDTRERTTMGFSIRLCGSPSAPTSNSVCGRSIMGKQFGADAESSWGWESFISMSNLTQKPWPLGDKLRFIVTLDML